MKRFFLSVLMLILILIQTSILPVFDGIHPDLIMALTLAAAQFATGYNAVWMGLGAGLLIDILCGPYLGVNALIYSAVGMAGIIVRKKGKTTIMSYIIPSVMAIIGIFIKYTLFQAVLFVKEWRMTGFALYTDNGLPETALTIAVLLLLLPLINLLYKMGPMRRDFNIFREH